jgi:prevent-host-death family protein
MSLTVKIGEAKARFSELVAKAEAGEEIIIARGREPVARLVRLPRPDAFSAVVAKVKAARGGSGRDATGGPGLARRRPARLTERRRPPL